MPAIYSQNSPVPAESSSQKCYDLIRPANTEASNKNQRDKKPASNQDHDYTFVFPRGDVDSSTVYRGLNQEMMMEGRMQLEKEINTLKGQLTQQMYELLQSDILTKENLLKASDKVTPSTVENKFVLLKRRYYVQDGLLHDVKRKDLIVFSPEKLFDLIMSAHVLNNHASPAVVYSHLSTTFANVTQLFCRLVVSFCSKCNANGEMLAPKKYKHKNMHADLIPLGRCHIEIFNPFQLDEGTDEKASHIPKIEGKYAYVLYCRDYHSRFVWLEPLKSVKQSSLLPAMAKLLFSLVRMPIFIDTCTFDRQDMFDLCESISRRYKIKIGLGVNSATSFQRQGIKRVKTLFCRNKEECLKDWNMCLKLVMSRLNQTYSDRVRGVPSDLLCLSSPDLHRKFRVLQKGIISGLMGHHVVQFEEAGGMIYLEDTNSSNMSVTESDIEEGESGTESNYEQFSDTEAVDSMQALPKRKIKELVPADSLKKMHNHQSKRRIAKHPSHNEDPIPDMSMEL